MSDGRRSITVRIHGQEYRIRSEADEQSVRRAAAFVDETMTRIRERTEAVDTLDIAVLAALNLANHLLAARSAAGGRAARELGLEVERLEALRELVEQVDAEVAAALAGGS